MESLRAYCKALILLLGVVAALPLSSAAQTHYKPHIWIGGRAGVSLSKQDITPSMPQSMLMGSTGAVTFRYSEEKLFGLVAEAGWCQRGWKEDFEESPLQYQRQLTYVNLTALTQIIFGGKRMKCFINLGPEFSYMIAENIKANFDYTDLSSVSDWPQRDRQTDQLAMPIHNKFDYGITASLGGEFYVRPSHSVTLEARYYFGLGNIFKATKADVFSASRCTSIEVTLGYYFRLK